ncbi:lysosome-associated membrane glycoprotein 2-like [Sabethes cyaneus]|uniref:lysosome-associated membrane glycoprotein 2-like n=1 Tax=Sabethes cyaneus TaxID=53552 RepID=UPI00221E2CA3|nr:lysosome-associated membrane glycoprotein 2-like [Sabethes cyaneus]
MKLVKCSLLLMAGLALCSAQNDPPNPPDSSTTTIEPTTEKPTTSTTTTTTSTSTTTSTTTAPPHTTTTPVPTTTAAPTTTSTAAPPAPTPAPGPVPAPEVGTWTYTNATTNKTCVLTQMALQLNVSYLDNANKPTHALYDVPKDARVVNGSCGSDSQYIVLSWGPPSIQQNSLVVVFNLNVTEHEFTLSGLTFVIAVYGESFPNAKDNQTITLVNKHSLFKTPLDMSYHCNRAQMLNLTSVDPAGLNSTVTVSKLQFEAFHNKANAKFSIAKDCDAIDTPDIVPIAVGCALILLIVIVLIAYLAGRRSTRSRGYLSM